MKIDEARNSYYGHSKALSDIVRQAAFAGIAVIWIFKVQQSNTLPMELAHPTLLMLGTLALDIMQYVYATAAWGIFGRYKETRPGFQADQEFNAPSAINVPTIILLSVKTCLLILGYFLLGIYLITRVF